MIVSIWRNFWCFSASKKSTSFFPFSKILFQRYCKHVILGILGEPDYAHQKWYYHLSYLSEGKKKRFHPTCFSGDIAKICKLCNLGTLGMPDYRYRIWLNQLVENLDVSQHVKNKLHFFTSPLRYFILKNPAVWLVNSISAHSSRTRIL